MTLSKFLEENKLLDKLLFNTYKYVERYNKHYLPINSVKEDININNLFKWGDDNTVCWHDVYFFQKKIRDSLPVNEQLKFYDLNFITTLNLNQLKIIKDCKTLKEIITLMESNKLPEKLIISI